MTLVSVSCSQINREKELVTEINNLQTINDSLEKIINESNGSILSSELRILSSSCFVGQGENINFSLFLKIQRIGDIYPYLYYSDTCLVNEKGFPTKLLGNIDSVKMNVWQADISLPQNEIGKKYAYFFVKRLNKFGDFEEYYGMSEFVVLTTENIKTIEKIIKKY